MIRSLAHYTRTFLLSTLGASLFLGCGSGMEIKKGDEDLSFLQEANKVRIEYDYSEARFGGVQDPKHNFEKKVFMKTRQKEWRDLWEACKDSLYKPKLDEMVQKYLNEKGGEDLKVSSKISREACEHLMIIQPLRFYIPEMGGYNPMGMGSGPREVRIDHRVLFVEKGAPERPLTVLEMEEVGGASLSFDPAFPAGNGIKNSMAVLGRETAKLIEGAL